MPEYYVTADSIITESGLIRNKVLFVKDGCIAGFQDESDIVHDASVVNYSGCVLSPCFCDYHLHFFGHNQDCQLAAVGALTASGITRVFEGGDKNLCGLKAKERLKDRLSIQSAGHAIFRKGTYGTQLGRGVDTVRDAGTLMRSLINDGVDYIKVIHSGIFEPETGNISPGGFNRNELKQIVAIAKDLGLDVACHVNGEQAVSEAVEAGVASIIHGLHVSRETLSVMAENNVRFIPTVNAFSNLEAIAVNNDAVANIEKVVENHLLAVKTAFDAGVAVLPGSDSGASFIPYGTSYHQELDYFEKAGLPSKYILSSSINSPLSIGDRADFLALRGFKIQGIFLDGVSSSQVSP